MKYVVGFAKRHWLHTHIAIIDNVILSRVLTAASVGLNHIALYTLIY